MIDTFMRQLVHDLELDTTIATAVDGAYTIPMEDDIKITVAALPDGGFFFTSPLGPCPLTNKEQFFTKALHGNLFGQGTHGAVIGLNGEGNLLTLSLVMNYNTDYKDFKDALENFINSMDFWREETLNHK
jgi:hypothetical protein